MGGTHRICRTITESWRDDA